MEQFFLQLGVSGGTLFILYKYLARTDERIDSRDKAFAKFVSEHNNQMTQLVVESTLAIKESTKAMKSSSELICKVSQQLEERIKNGH